LPKYGAVSILSTLTTLLKLIPGGSFATQLTRLNPHVLFTSCRYRVVPIEKPDWTTVQIIKVQGGEEFHRNINAWYYSHIVWISMSSEGPSPRAMWLRRLLDNFARELNKLEGGGRVDWRSRCLNPFLVRTLYGVGEGDERTIIAEAKGWFGRTDTLRVKDWAEFYTHADVISPKYHPNYQQAIGEGFLIAPAPSHVASIEGGTPIIFRP
jgi:hypothetical protein